MSRKTFLMCLSGILMALFLCQTAMAYDPDWKANQQNLFGQTKLKPGDVINASNWQKVQGLVPESVVGYVKQGEFDLKIGEMKYDWGADEAWEKASELNRGKYDLAKNKAIIDKSTGTFPLYIYGRAFPHIDWKNDPDAGIKIMHNKTVEEGRTGQLTQYSTTIFFGKKDVDRTLFNYVPYITFWAHPRGEQPNPNKFKNIEIIKLVSPYDLAGTTILMHRMLDGSPDRGGSYVPALRRVRKTSGVNRSDPFFGSEFITDDTTAWGGQNETMIWKVLGEKVVLVPVTNWQAEHPDILVQQPNGAWKSQKNIPALKFGCDDKTWKGASHAPLHAVWVPREVYLVEATPIDPYYNVGKQLYYMDKKELVPFYKISQDKAGQHWKTFIYSPYVQQWDDSKRKTLVQGGWFISIDDKRHHCSGTTARGPWRNYDSPLDVLDPLITMDLFTFEGIAVMSK